MKTRLAVILSILLIFTAIPASAFAAGEDIASGTSGTCDWVIDADGVLTISAGEMGDWYPEAPWSGYASEIRKVKVSGPVKLMTGNNMFADCISLTELDASNFDTSNVENMQRMFFDCRSLKSVDVSSFITSNVVSMDEMFFGCQSLKNLDLSNFNTSKVEDMGGDNEEGQGMFEDCSSLESLDVSNFDTSNVRNMYSMFSGCGSLKSLDVGSFDTSNTEDMNGMFSGCSSLKSLDISNFDTSNTEYMENMFSGCSSLKSLDVSKFDMSNVQSMACMFRSCSSLTSLDLRGLITSDARNMYGLFDDCTSLTDLNISNLDTSSARNMAEMFAGCCSLKQLDLKSFDTANVKNMAGMFAGCSSLSTFDLSSFDTSYVKYMEGMFDSCKSLKELKLGKWSTDRIEENSYAVFPVTMYDKDNNYKVYLKDDKVPSVTMHTFVSSVPPLQDGQETKVSTGTVKVLSAEKKTAAFTKAVNRKSVAVPATVTVNGHVLKVTQINAKAFTGKKIKTVTISKNVKVIKKNAFKGSKVTKLIIKTKLLKKSSVKGALKGSKIKTGQVKIGKRSVNVKYIKKYKKFFSRKNSGRKIKVI